MRSFTRFSVQGFLFLLFSISLLHPLTLSAQSSIPAWAYGPGPQENTGCVIDQDYYELPCIRQISSPDVEYICVAYFDVITFPDGSPRGASGKDVWTVFSQDGDNYQSEYESFSCKADADRFVWESLGKVKTKNTLVKDENGIKKYERFEDHISPNGGVSSKNKFTTLVEVGTFTEKVNGNNATVEKNLTIIMSEHEVFLPDGTSERFASITKEGDVFVKEKDAGGNITDNYVIIYTPLSICDDLLRNPQQGPKLCYTWEKFKVLEYSHPGSSYNL